MAVQLDDMNPGIAPSGLFWTMAIDDDDVRVELGDRRATMDVNNVAVRDFGDFNNALAGGPSQPANVSFEIRWFGGSKPEEVVNPAGEMSGRFIRNSAQMEWAARVGDFSFVSRPARTSSSVFAEIGHEKNGTFFYDHS